MNREQFDTYLRHAIDDVTEEPDHSPRLRTFMAEFMESLDDRAQDSIIEDYKKLALEKRAILRDRVETMVALCQLREFEPEHFVGKSKAQGVLDYLGPSLEDDAQKYLNAEYVVGALMAASSDIQVRRYRASQQAAKHPVPPKRGDKGR
ncbi:hypothetical protein [Hyalangium gracile]|uniref:hypothetical protein n=1 Tax=Hyalangium gracile TaxID=394092 RepID=UPI001CCD1A86|nr:hypothetical protein [Hyalangium gracile]